MRTETLETEIVQAPPAAPKKLNLRRWAFLAVIGMLATLGVRWWIVSQGYESTDDSQIEGHLDSVSPRISGTVTWIDPKVENNRFVDAGTLLLVLDPRDYEAALEHAKAGLDTSAAETHAAQVSIPVVDASAFGQLHSAEAAKERALAAVNTARSEMLAGQHKLQQDEAVAARAERDRVRYQALVEKHEIARADYDARETDAVAATQAVEADRANLSALEQRIAEAQSFVTEREAEIDSARAAPQQVTGARAKVDSASGRVELARADLHTAQLNLSYTKIYAPVSGVIGRKTVELGHRVQPGQTLLVIVPLDDIWVTANFKETQMKRMRPGEPVEIHVDALGRTFHGKVESMPGAAGPLFSLFPPENSSGNYVKVVQRFPVRIRFDAGQDPEHLLRPGMSVEPDVTRR